MPMSDLYANATNGGTTVRDKMTRGETISGLVNAYIYSTSLPATRLASDYTPRIIPFFTEIAVPLEGRILWQK
jgi:glycogen phosphorylase